MTNSKSGTLNMKNFTDVLLREVHDYMDPEMTVRIVKISKPNREPEQAMVFAAINMDETLSPAIYTHIISSFHSAKCDSLNKKSLEPWVNNHYGKHAKDSNGHPYALRRYFRNSV